MKGKTVVITGGTSGIGEIAAERLAQMGLRAVGSPKQVPDPVQPWLQWPMATGIPQEPVRHDVPCAVRGLVLGTHARSVVTGDEGRTC